MLVFIPFAFSTFAQAPLVSLQNGSLVYNKYANRGQTNLVNQIPDFSNAGYKGGGVRIPELPVRETITAVQGDCRQLIQDAINRVAALPLDANGFRGAVLLKAGIYSVEGSLTITASGVVLRGEGNLADGTGTVLIATQKTQHNFIVLQGTGSGYAEVSGSRVRIASTYVPTGTKTVEVIAGHTFQVGDKVVLQKTPNDAWINLLNMAQYGWTASAYRTTYERQIVAIDANKLTLDIPVMDPIETQYGGGDIYKSNINGRINNCGVENMRIESYFASRTDESHGWNAVFLSRVENSWVRHVIVKYFGFGAVNLTNMSRFNTVEDCGMIDPVSQTTGGRKYSFNLETNSTNNLFQRCMTWGGRHDYVSGSKVPGPNVFLDCIADNTFDDIGPHHRYSTGQLYDNVYGGAIRVQNRGASGSGHGWSGAQILFWNCRSYESDIEVESPPSARNWGIGCVGLTQTNTGYWESWGTQVLPRSLYLQQLQERLGATAVQNITTTDQVNNVLRQKLITRARATAAEAQVAAAGDIGAFDLTDNGGILTAQYTTTSRPDQTYDKIIDNNYTTAYYQSGRTALWVQYRSAVSAIVTRYTITSSFEVEARDPVDWNLQGSNNGTSWTTLDTRTGEDFPTRSLTRTFQVNNTLPFLFYRLNITKNAGNANTQFNEWELFQRKQQQISIGDIPPVTYGDDPVELVVSAGSGLPISIQVLSGPGFIVADNFLKIEGVGSIVIRVTQAGDENYFPATRNYTVFVNKADQTIDFPALSPKVYGDSDFDLSATSDSKLPVTYTSSDPSIASITGNTVHILSAGQVTITANQPGSSLYNAAASESQTLTINKRALTVTALPQVKEYGSANPALTAGFDGFVNGDDVGSFTSPPVLATNATNQSRVGTYPITVSGGVSANYEITYIEGTLTVNPKQLTVAADNKEKVYGSANPPLTATYDGFVNGDDVGSLDAAPVLSTDADNSSPTGQYSINIAGGTSGNYTFLLQAGILTVNKAPLSISAENKSKTYGSLNPPLTVLYDGFANGDDAASLTTQPIITTTASEFSIVGQYPIAVSGAESKNYMITYNDATLTITQASQSISFSVIADRFEGDPSFDLDVSSTSSLPIRLSSSDPSVASVSGKTVTIHAPGTVTFSANQEGDVNFKAAPEITQAFTVKAWPIPTITANGTVSFCPGSSVVLSSSEASGYQWLLNGSPINPSAKSITATSSGNYSVEVTYSNGLKKTSGSMTVVVEDVTRPTVFAKNITVSLVNGSVTVSASNLDNGSYDNCSALTFSLDKSSFDCSNIGNNNVLLTATDAAGNSASLPCVITVLGTIPAPVITITKSNTTYTGLAENTIAIGYGPQSVTLSAPASSDAYTWSGSSLLSSISGNAVTFTPSTEGTYLISLTAVSQSGCSSTASASIHVLDVRCGNKLDKVLVCKPTESSTNSFVEMCVDENSVATHLTNGGTLGACTQSNTVTSKTKEQGGVKYQKAVPVQKTTTVVEGTPNENLELIVYPNPTQGKIRVKIKDGKNVSYRVTLFDAGGRLIKSLSVKRGAKAIELLFDLEEKSPGVYYLRFSDGKNIWVRKIIKE